MFFFDPPALYLYWIGVSNAINSRIKNFGGKPNGLVNLGFAYWVCCLLFMVLCRFCPDFPSAVEACWITHTHGGYPTGIQETINSNNKINLMIARTFRTIHALVSRLFTWLSLTRSVYLTSRKYLTFHKWQLGYSKSHRDEALRENFVPGFYKGLLCSQYYSQVENEKEPVLLSHNEEEYPNHNWTGVWILYWIGNFRPRTVFIMNVVQLHLL